MTAHPLDAWLGLTTPAIAITFSAAAPPGVARVAHPEPAGCGYWRRAASGEVFYTTADDHVHCPVGAHTHGVPLTPAQGESLGQLVKVMVDLQYLTMDDVKAIPQRQGAFGVVVYAPLALAPLPPDVVLLRGNPGQLMLLAEAVQAAGVAGAGPARGRPTCAVVPEAINTARSAASFGCVGNRVYTGASEGEAWFALPGPSLDAVAAKLSIILHANQELAKFHAGRKTQFQAEVAG